MYRKNRYAPLLPPLQKKACAKLGHWSRVNYTVIAHDSLAPAPGWTKHCTALHCCRPSCSNTSLQAVTNAAPLGSPLADWQICKWERDRDRYILIYMHAITDSLVGKCKGRDRNTFVFTYAYWLIIPDHAGGGRRAAILRKEFKFIFDAQF